jgi:hypothetical protein
MGNAIPYPTHYRLAFAFSTILYPQPFQLTLRLAFPMGGLWAYHVLSVYPCRLGPASPPGVHCLCIGEAKAPIPDPLPFGPSVLPLWGLTVPIRTAHHLSLVVVHDVYRRFTYVGHTAPS